MTQKWLKRAAELQLGTNDFQNIELVETELA